MADPIVENVKIEKLQVELKPPLDNPKHGLVKLIPRYEPERMSFLLKNANTALANGLRRIVQGELPVKRMLVNISDIMTNEEYIMLAEITDRIKYIPISQDVPDGTRFHLSVVNDKSRPTVEYLMIRSGDIKPDKGDAVPFAGSFRLAELRPGKHLIINNITVTTDYGYNDASACLTHDIQYEIVDYINVAFLNERANVIESRVRTTELMVVLKKMKQKADPDTLFRSRILVIPNAAYQRMAESQLPRLRRVFDIIIEDTEIKRYQSTEIRAREFYLTFTTYGNIPVRTMMQTACDSIITRLGKIRDAISEPNQLIWMDQDNVKATLTIRGEDHTVAQLFKHSIMELDPGVGLVNDPGEHPQIRTVVLNIRHPNAKQLVIDAANLAIKQFTAIKTQLG